MPANSAVNLAKEGFSIRFTCDAAKAFELWNAYIARNLEIFVVRQPDGTGARLPAWMFEEASACFALGTDPDFPLEVLRGLRREIDVLLRCLQSDSRTQEPADANRRQTRSARPVRRHRITANEPDAGRGNRSASAPSSDVRTDRERDEGTGG